ncbi:MAG: ABC transporter permease [Pseudomonadales bacterium]
MPGLVTVLYRQRSLLLATSREALLARFRGSILGVAWLLIYPLAFLAMYATVFIVILGVRIPELGTYQYVQLIFCGLVPFLAFAESFGVGTVSIVANRGLLKNTLFPIELVVARDVLVGHATMGLGMVLVWVTVAVNGHLYWTHLAVPLVYLLQILMTLGIVWITASLTVFFRDFQQATPIIILFLMLVSPIAYTNAMVPENLRPLLDFNPLAWIMKIYRECLMDGTLPVAEIAILAAFSFAVLKLGHVLISRLKPLFHDYL